jgi:DNA-binding response OmpR family regulator
VVDQHSPCGPAILVVDDEDSVLELLRYELGRDGYRVCAVSDGMTALKQLDACHFDLVVLDIMLPDIDGIEVLKRLRARSMVPVIMLTACSDEVDRVVGLELGADDYVSKDLLSIREFRSRVHAQLRRAAHSQLHTSSDEVRRVGPLELDTAKRTVRLGERVVRLTFAEFEILKALTAQPGTVYSRRMLLQVLWGDAKYRDERTVDTHIRHLREKLEPEPASPEMIFTVRNAGYSFRES